MQSYFPSALKDKVKIEIKAEPDEYSKEAVNSQKLAAVLSFADYKAVKGWTGHFLVPGEDSGQI